MKNHLLDAMKGIAKLLGLVLFTIGYPFYKSGRWLLDLRSSRDKILDEAIKQAEAKKKKKTRAPRKKTTPKESAIQVKTE